MYEKLAQDIGRLVDKKAAAYGDSAGVSGDFFRLLFPNGIPPDQYDNVLLFARMFDKIKRIATNRDSFNEDPFQDLVGYALLGSARNRKPEAEDHSFYGIPLRVRDGVTATVEPAPAVQTSTEQLPTALQPCSPSCEVCADLRKQDVP